MDQFTFQVAAPPIEMLDLARYVSDRRIARIDHSPAAINIGWDDGSTSQFSAAWLRDNCACRQCRHPITMERLFSMLDHPGAIRIDDAAVAEQTLLSVMFDRGGASQHDSHYPSDWLWHHRCGSPPAPTDTTVQTLWTAAVLPQVPTFEFAAVMSDDQALDTWLHCVAELGVSLVVGMPIERGTVQRLAERVGQVRATNFGMLFEVESKPNPNNAAYTALGLDLHTDIPNVPSPPGVQLLHCIVNEAQGGGSILVDGFRVAEELRVESEGDYRLLADNPITFRFHDAEVDLAHRAPVLLLDGAGRVAEVRFNNWIRAALDVPVEIVEAYYGALMHYWRLLREPRFQLRFRLAAGQAMVFDNQRILHGREEFDPQTGARLLQGCYFDYETLRSRRRVIARGRLAPVPA